MAWNLLDEISLLSTLLVALFKCTRNALNPALWYSVLLFMLLSSCSLGILYAVQYLGGGLAYVINKVIYALNRVRHFFSHHSRDWDVEVLDALSGLVDGTCKDFQEPATLAKYGLNKLFSEKWCDKIRWYESITLTRVIIARPVRAIFTNTEMLREHSCSMRLVSDMCAWVVGTEAVLKYMMKKGLWILVCLYIFAPCIAVVYHAIQKVVGQASKRIQKFADHLLPKIFPNHKIPTNKGKPLQRRRDGARK